METKPFNKVVYKGIFLKKEDTFNGYVGSSDCGEWGVGTYWTTHLDCASIYGDYIVTTSVCLNNPFYAIADYDDELIYEIDYESASILAVVELFGKEEGIRLIKEAQLHGPKGLFTYELEEKLKPLGYDGIVATWEDGSQHVVVFGMENTKCEKYNRD